MVASAFPHITIGNTSFKSNDEPVRIALIGRGGMGAGNANTALQVPGVKLVAVCDLYDVRLQAAKNNWGDHIVTTRKYEDILSRSDVDAVIVATSDHWHQKISIDAMKAGKHVYCEKPVIHKISEAKELVEVQQASGKVFQTGSQGMASIGNRKAKQLVQSGAIGNVNLIEGVFTARPRQNCRTQEGVTADDLWWERYIMNSPKVPFDQSRFFCWRLWKDYGTGIAGDLFVHVLSSLQYIMDVPGPERVYATGEADGIGDTPYIILGYFDYAGKKTQQPFKVALTANHADPVSRKWGSTDFMMIGNNGTLQVLWDRVILKRARAVSASEFSDLPPLGNSIDTPQQISQNELLFMEDGYNRCHLDHFNNFFDGIRKKTKIEGDVMFSVQSAAPALMCFESYLTGKPVYWNAEKLTTQSTKG